MSSPFLRVTAVLLSLAAYSLLGIVSTAYVNERRRPTPPPDGYEYSLYEDSAEREHVRRACLAGLVWPVYWTYRGAAWAVAPRELTPQDIAEAELDRLHDEYEELTRDDRTQDMIEFYREEIAEHRAEQSAAL